MNHGPENSLDPSSPIPNEELPSPSKDNLNNSETIIKDTTHPKENELKPTAMIRPCQPSDSNDSESAVQLAQTHTPKGKETDNKDEYLTDQSSRVSKYIN